MIPKVFRKQVKYTNKSYKTSIKNIANKLKSWQDTIILISHVDPDGDALGSALALKRALDSLGKKTLLPMKLPQYLSFLVREGEVIPILESLPDQYLLLILDTEAARAEGAPIEKADFIINIDHHPSNDGSVGDLICIEPSKAATCQLAKDLIDALAIKWTEAIATPCLVGIITDTGNLRFANTNSETLKDVAELMEYGVAYSELTDRLQWRHPDYFKMLGKVMSSVSFPLNGLVVMAEITQNMRNEVGETNDDSNDYVGLIRYAEGTHVALFFKERGKDTKVSVRSRGKVSAQAICVALGGGGHHAAAGATLEKTSLNDAKMLVLKAVEVELKQHEL